MFPEIQAGVTPDGENPGPDQSAAAGGEGGDPAGVSPLAEVGECGGLEAGGASGAGGRSEEEGNGGNDEALGEELEENPVGAGVSPPRQHRNSHRISDRAFKAALIASEGHIASVAKALGCTEGTVRNRIKTHAELNAVYGVEARGGNRVAPSLPTVADTMLRGPDDLPEGVAGVELAELTSEIDRQAYRDALKEYGISEGQLKKLKALDGLAKNGGRLLSVSLQMTHQNYVGQLHNLAEIADALRDRLRGKALPDGKVADLNFEEYATLSKVYVECVKEAGTGYKLMMAGTEAMVRMLMASKSTAPQGQPAEIGWGPMKKIRAAKQKKDRDANN